MPRFELERRIPSCHVTKRLLGAIEEYLQVEMRRKFGETLGDEITYKISIKEKIGTETLASVSEYSPSTFSDGTKEIKVRWENGYRAKWRLAITIDLRGDRLMLLSNLEVECNAPTARETAIGVRDAILRVLESHRTYNWIFNPLPEFPVVPVFVGGSALYFLIIGFQTILTNREQGLYVICGAVIAAWIVVSAIFF